MMRRFYALLPLFVTLLMPTDAWAESLNVGDSFKSEGITFRVTSTNPKEVQVGEGTSSSGYVAIDKNTEGPLTIPSNVMGNDGNSYSVTSIGERAFYDCGKLTSISLPNTLIDIEYGAFEGCYGVKSIELPNSLKSIDAGAFHYCI